jgi:uncharacterized membrane protein YeaQ/YmgE (transglycosylase-associated protein family)
MSPKIIIYLFSFIGSIIGGYVPQIWGAGLFSISSLIFSTIGAVAGFFIGLRFTE